MTKHFYEGSLEANYKLLMLEKPHLKLGFTTFRLLKPVFVQKIRVKDRRVCLCKYHTNVMFGVNVLCRLKRFLRGFPLPRVRVRMNPASVKKVPLSESMPVLGSSSDLWYATKCQFGGTHPNMECMTGACKECGPEQLALEVDPDSAPKPPTVVTWSRYEYIDALNRKGEQVRRIHLVPRIDSIPEFLDIFMADWSKYNYHSFEARWQSKQFRDLLDMADNDDSIVVLTADFIMNIGVKPMYEVQSAFYTTEQITLLVFISHHKHSGVMAHHFISDDLRHDSAMYAYSLEKVLSSLGSLHQRDGGDSNKAGASTGNATDGDRGYWHGKNVVVFTDGAGSQFKCANAVLSDLLLRTKLGLNRLEHNFFSTSHGKGLHDGEGGSLKYLVTHAMIKKDVGDTLINAKSVYDFSEVNFKSTVKSESAIPAKAAAAVVKGRIFYLVEEDDIATYRAAFATSTTVPGTLKLHQFISMSSFDMLDVKTRNLSCFCACCWDGEYAKCENIDWVQQPVMHTMTSNKEMVPTAFKPSEILLGEVVAIKKSVDDTEDTTLDAYRFYLLHVTGALEKLASTTTDDYGNKFRTGTNVLRGKYYNLVNAVKKPGVYQLSSKEAIVYANSIVARSVKLKAPGSVTGTGVFALLRCNLKKQFVMCEGESNRVESVL